MTVHDPDQMLTPAEVADLLRVPQRRLKYWRQLGRGPKFVRLSHAAVRYRRVDVSRYIAERAAAEVA